jgi:hypothetical protein
MKLGGLRLGFGGSLEPRHVAVEDAESGIEMATTFEIDSLFNQ